VTTLTPKELHALARIDLRVKTQERDELTALLAQPLPRGWVWAAWARLERVGYRWRLMHVREEQAQAKKRLSAIRFLRQP
jgi:hypothetical protein